MKRTKKVAALLLTAVMVLSFAACGDKDSGSGGGGDSKTPDAKTLISDATKKMEKVKNLDADMNMKMAMSMQGKEMMNMDMTMKMSALEDPVMIKMDMTMKASQQGQAAENVSVSMYGEEKDGKMVMYMSPDGTNWMKQTTALENTEQYQAKDDMDLYLKSGTDFKVSGTEKVGDSEAYKLEGVIGSDYMSEVLKSSGAMDQLGALLQGSSVDDLLKDVGDMPVIIWVDKESGYPVKYSMDMTEVMSKLFSKVFEAAGGSAEDFSFDKMTMEMTCSNFNKVEKFEIPDAAKNAVEGNLGL